MFYAPSSVFRRREKGNFFIPLAVITILCAALFYLNSGALQPIFDAEFDRGMATAMRQNPNIPPEAAERMRSFGMILQQVGMFIFLPIAILGIGIATWLAGKLVDASLGFGRFLDPDAVSPLLLSVVGRIDLITLWITVLVAIGLCVTGRIPMGKAAIAAAIVWLMGGLPLIIPALRAM